MAWKGRKAFQASCQERYARPRGHTARAFGDEGCAYVMRPISIVRNCRLRGTHDQIRPWLLKLVWRFLPTITWSWTVRPTAAIAWTTCLVISMSAREGVGSP